MWLEEHYSDSMMAGSSIRCVFIKRCITTRVNILPLNTSPHYSSIICTVVTMNIGIIICKRNDVCFDVDLIDSIITCTAEDLWWVGNNSVEIRCTVNTSVFSEYKEINLSTPRLITVCVITVSYNWCICITGKPPISIAPVFISWNSSLANYPAAMVYFVVSICTWPITAGVHPPLCPFEVLDFEGWCCHDEKGISHAMFITLCTIIPLFIS